MREGYIEECKRIQENCTYTAEAHHVVAYRSKRQAYFFQAIPAAAAALLAALVAGGVIPTWFAWVSAMAAVVSAVGNVLDPLKSHYDHLLAGKNFTALKHDARALHETFSHGTGDAELCVEVKKLHDRYNDLVKFVPQTGDKAFQVARAKIKQGIHDPDE